MEHSILIILLALLQYLFFLVKVGSTRGKYNIDAPNTTGNEIWERYYRVQQNTMEQLVLFIPGIIIFTLYVNEMWALLPGILFIVGRQLYYITYTKDPKTRALGMVLTFVSNAIFIIGSMVALALNYIG